MTDSGPITADLEEAISEWEESVRWIEKGWDCIEEYTHDLSFRETLSKALLRYPSRDAVPSELLSRVTAADKAFRKATVASSLCVWHCSPQFRHYPDGHVEVLFEPYDEEAYWYYYRWQADCPYPWRDHDSMSYQREVYGLDFQNMSTAELEEAARREVARWREWLRNF